MVVKMGKVAIIGTVGDSHDPIIYHVNKVKPDLVCFLYTERTENYLDDIIKKCNIKNHMPVFLNNPNDVDDTFSKSLNAINELLKNDYEVIGNFTAGTKPMSVGLAMACIEKHCKYEYGYGIRDEKTGMSISFEDNFSQENPYENQAINEFKRGKLLFNKYQFTAAYENFKIAQKILKVDELKLRADIFVKIINFYDFWDKFNDDVDSIPLNIYLENNILNVIEKNHILKKYFSEELPDFYKQLKLNKLFLDYKIHGSFNYHLPDLLNNAKRRIKENKYDDAIARLYRAMELIAQLRLNEYGFIEKNNLNTNKTFFINKEKLKNELSLATLRKIDKLKLYGWDNDKKKYLHLDLSSNYKLLKSISHENEHELSISTKKLCSNYENIKFDLKKRNTSILAHGLKPLGKEETEMLYNSVLEHSKILYPNIKRDMIMARFPLFEEE